MTERTGRMVQHTTTALLWPAGRRLRAGTARPGHDFALVSTLADYNHLLAAGQDSILVHRRPSGYFEVPTIVRAAGPLIIPWRWRRVLLNEGINHIHVPLSLGSAPVVAAALLAGSRIRVTTVKRGRIRTSAIPTGSVV